MGAKGFRSVIMGRMMILTINVLLLLSLAKGKVDIEESNSSNHHGVVSEAMKLALEEMEYQCMKKCRKIFFPEEKAYQICMETCMAIKKRNILTN